MGSGNLRRTLAVGAVFAHSLSSLSDLRKRYTIAGAPTLVNSPFGKALSFDGANDYVTLGEQEEYNLRFDSGAQDFSIMCRVRVTASALHVIFDKRDSGGDGYLFYVSGGGGAILTLDAITIAGIAAAVSNDVWHHVAVVIDRSGNGQMYVDGATSGAAVAIGSEAMATTRTPRIGASSTDGTSPFTGELRDISIWDRIVTAGEVLAASRGQLF